jgi:hypothetical protein
VSCIHDYLVNIDSQIELRGQKVQLQSDNPRRLDGQYPYYQLLHFHRKDMESIFGAIKVPTRDFETYHMVLDDVDYATVEMKTRHGGLRIHIITFAMIHCTRYFVNSFPEWLCD